VSSFPSAKALAYEIPTVAVRLRRDFPMLLSLIRAHALLPSRVPRQRQARRIVATFADYAIVRELVADLFSEGVDATLQRRCGRPSKRWKCSPGGGVAR